MVQDDVELCDGFAAAVTQAIASKPNSPLALFTSWGSRTAQVVRLAALTGESWAPVVDRFVPPVALVLPAPEARDFARHTETLDLTVTDGKALTNFLESRGADAYVSVPNLVEHDSEDSLMGHHIMMGVRRSALFSAMADAPHPMNGSVASVTTVAHLDGLSGYTAIYPGSATSGEAIPPPAHNVLGQAGMTGPEITDLFLSDLRRSPSADPSDSGFGRPLLFQLWLAMFAMGAQLPSALGDSSPGALETALERPLSSLGLSTFPSGVLCRILPDKRLTKSTEQLLPLCVGGICSGFAATSTWPRLNELLGR
ncbi:hypothetical protein H3147_10095 [Streptomyces sp. OF8]|uniref:Uncharacterized protein n=1 Tax=Streptomyces alkaliterrae TaxID=2213162 RepID=A0A5P0YQI2_9ACTN|nr:hypothetical protein [Streptomyces alkaliterrae]MQS00789.1 hypothetical protein [Streptomyces alkaliterrae]